MKQNTTILIVDDESDGRRLMARLLNRLECNLAFAGNGPEAITKAIKIIPDLILLDVMMPGMSGYEVCEHLRADSLLAEVPIIMLTALDDRRSLIRGIRAGADDFVKKPFDTKELLTRVETILRLNRYRRLRAERTKFAWVVDQAEDGYLIINETDDILYANAKARFYLGLPADINTPVDENFLTLSKKQYHCEPEAAWITWPDLSEGDVTRYLVRPETPASHAFWLQARSLNSPMGLEAGIVVQLKNITDQVNLKHETHNFHAMISHKLRTPLGGIFGGMELILEYARKLPDTRIVEIGNIVFENMRRLRDQVDDIVEYLYSSTLLEPDSDFVLSQLPMMLTKVSANLDLESVTVSGQEKLANAQIMLSEQTLELVLWEILENAKKFHPQKTPTVEVFVSCCNPGQVCLKISDDGVHLSPEQLLKVWTPYYQADKYFTGEVTGMGLGLSMAAMIIWGAGGTCHIYNREDKLGIVVELILPLVKNSDSTSV